MAKTKEAQRRDAAEEVCFMLIVMMDLGLLEIPRENRPMLGEPLQEWADLAYATGKLRE